MRSPPRVQSLPAVHGDSQRPARGAARMISGVGSRIAGNRCTLLIATSPGLGRQEHNSRRINEYHR